MYRCSSLKVNWCIGVARWESTDMLYISRWKSTDVSVWPSWKSTDVWKGLAFSIFRFEEYARQVTDMKTKHSSLLGVISWQVKPFIANATRTRIPIVLSHDRVTVGWFWIDNLATFAARGYTSQITVTHRVVLSVTLRCDGLRWWTFRDQVITDWQPSYPNLVLWPLTSAGTSFNCYGGSGSSPRQVMCDLWWTKWHWDRFPPRTSVLLPILI
jgi:hypothetical protein